MPKMKIFKLLFWVFIQILTWFSFAIMFKYYDIKPIAQKNDIVILITISLWFLMTTTIKLYFTTLKNKYELSKSTWSQKNDVNNG
jgi:hypothetical protein